MRENINNLGVFPTPKYVVSQINSHVLQLLREQILPSLSNSYIRVLDNSVGDGRFLFDFARNWINMHEAVLNLPEIQLYGVDINPKSIEKCNIKLRSFKGNDQIKFIFNQGNSLLGYINKPKDISEFDSIEIINRKFIDDHDLKDIEDIPELFHWFYEVKDGEEGKGFDVCLGNPPFGIKFSPALKKIFKKLYISLDPEVESYILFVERSISLLRDKGILALLIPNNFATNLRYKKFRKYLLDNLELKKIINLDYSVFSNVSVETCILIGVKKPSSDEFSGNKIEFSFFKKETGLSEIGTRSQDEIRTSDQLHIGFFSPSSYSDIIERIRCRSILLGDIVFINRGIELGFRSKVTSDEKITSQSVKLVAGRNIHPFTLEGPIRYIQFDSSNKRIYKDRSIYEKPKILLRRIGHKLISVYDPNNLFCVCDVYILSMKPEWKHIPETYLVSLLNSSVLNFYLNQQFRSVKKIFPKIPIKYLKQLPVIIPGSVEEINEIANLASIIDASSDQSKLQTIDTKVFEIYSLKERDKVRVETYLLSL